MCFDEQLIRDIEATMIDPSEFTQKFEDIAELEQAKLALWQATFLPLEYPELFEGNLRCP